MHNLQKYGGIAALVEAATFVFGFLLYFTLLASARYGSLEVDPIQHVTFLVEHKAIMYTWNFVIYVLFGMALVVLALALHERLKTNSPVLMQIATAFGLIWAGLVIASGMVANLGAEAVINLYNKDPSQAAATWRSLEIVINGLGGGNEIVGGTWVLLISLSALGTKKLPVAFNWLGIIIGLAGLLTSIPALGDLGSVFGLGLIAWFIWLGLVMLRKG